MKRKEKCVRFRLRISYGSNNIAARTYVYNWHTSADRVFWSFFPLSTFFVSASATFFFLFIFSARVYSITSLQDYVVVFLSFFLNFFSHFVLSSVYSLRAFFFSLSLFFCSSFLSPLFFATNHTTRYPYFRLFDY